MFIPEANVIYININIQMWVTLSKIPEELLHMFLFGQADAIPNELRIHAS